MEDLSLHDILAIFRRRRMIFMLTAGSIFVATLLFTLSWSRYRATTTVQIEQSEISTSAVNGEDLTPQILADRRINQVQQKVMSTESLNKIIDALGLYPGSKKTMSAANRAKIMENSAHLDFITSNISNPAATQKESIDQLSAIAFTLSFSYNDPKLAKAGLDALVKAFIDEDANQRRTQNEKTTAFLDAELKRLEDTIKDQEKKIAEFKAKFGESGPSAVMFNQQASLNNSLNLQTIENQITTNQATIATLRVQLASADPYAPALDDTTKEGKMINSPKGQKKALQSQYATLIGRYGPQHPDVLKVRAQLEALNKEPANSTLVPSREADNPLYLQLSAQLAAAEGQQNGLLAQRASLKAQQDKYNRFVAENPLVEQQMSELSLDLDNAKKRYATLTEKKSAAAMRANLEAGGNSARLTIINPSTIPEGTTPSRKILLLAGTFFGILCGLAMVIVTEALSQAVRGANHLAGIVGVAPLVSVPHISVSPRHG